MGRIKNVAQVVSLLLWALFPTVGTAEAPSDFDEVVYHTCYDGDTCMVSLPGVHVFFGDHILVRLAGIDTPEIKGKCEREKRLAKEARDVVRGILSGATRVELKRAERDKYFRINARVIADGEDVSAVLLIKGLAIAYDGGTKTKDWCAAPAIESPAPAEPLFFNGPTGDDIGMGSRENVIADTP